MRSTAFKKVLATMPLGSDVTIESPSCDLTLHHDVAWTAVFLAGGIGITPYRSKLVWAAKEQIPQHLVLFYSNRRRENAPFLDELHTLEKKNPNSMLIATMTDMLKSHQPWSGENGPGQQGHVFQVCEWNKLRPRMCRGMNQSFKKTTKRTTPRAGTGMTNTDRCFKNMDWDKVEEEVRCNWGPAKMGLWKRYKDAMHFAWERVCQDNG